MKEVQAKLHTKFKVVKTDTLKENPNNPRKHSTAQVEAISSSIRNVGFASPIVCDEEMTILAGHGRYLAAKSLGIPEVPVVILSNLTPTQKRQFLIADNRLLELSSWDKDLLAENLQAIIEDGPCDFSAMGFTEFDVMKLVADRTPMFQEDDLPEEEEEERAVSHPGDLWILGPHRVLCGDATSEEAVKKVIGGMDPVIMVTDPPYGVRYDPKWRNKYRAPSERVGTVPNDHRTDWGEAFRLFRGAIAYVWHPSVYTVTSAKGVMDADFEIKQQIIWVKHVHALSRGHYQWKHEPCWYAVRKGGSASWKGGRNQMTVWEIAPSRSYDLSEGQKTTHGTQKPVECMRRPIVNHTKNGDVVYDPFLGSGTTLIAAESVGRAVCGLELDPKYVDMIVRRYIAFVGGEKEVLHEETGLPWSELRKQRLGK